MHELTRRFGSHLAVDDVSLEVPTGMAYGLAGSNGAGKSTLLRMLALRERPTAGRMRILGVDPYQEPGAARRLIGYAGPAVGTALLTVYEELEVAAELRGVPSTDRRDTVLAMLQLVDLYDRRARPVGELSLGDRKRMALARALVHDPTLVLLDAPFDGLDGGSRTELRAVLGELAAMGKTLVITAGTVAELADLCAEVGLMDRGRLIASGSPEEVLAATGSPELEQALRAVS